MDHDGWVLSSCRVCGGRLSKHKVSYDCHSTENQARLQCIGVSVESDSKDIHPRRFCHSCYCICTRTIRANTSGKLFNSKLVKFHWEEHSEECSVCQHFGKGRKPTTKRNKSTGRPPYLILDFIGSITAKSPPSLLFEVQLRERLSLNPSSEGLICQLCHLVLDRPIVLVTCNQMVCLKCCADHVYQYRDLSCPCCSTSHTLDVSTVIPATTVVTTLLRSLEVTCTKCKRPIKAVQFKEHLCSMNPPAESLHDVVAKPVSEPLSLQENQLATSLVRRKIAQGSDGGMLQFKTGGQPITLMKASKSRIPSTQATTKTVLSRSKELDVHRRFCTGGDHAFQLAKEVKACSLEERESILQELQNGFKVIIPLTFALAMKADLGIPWSKLRAIRRWFKECRVSIASEKTMRKRALEVVGDCVVVEKVPLTFPLKDGNGGEEVKLRPFGFIPDLWSRIVQLLEENEKHGRLSWHNGRIPEEEIWVKIGGDKGGGTFKMAFQIVNVIHPNAPNNTCVFAIFEAPDSITNLTVMADRFVDQVNGLHTKEWRGKKIKPVYCGDYEFLTRSYGLSGASGRHCCMWCHITAEDLKLSPSLRGPVQPRSDSTLKADLARFTGNGSNIKRAKFYNNVIREPIFNLSLDQVCPPGLHITLGIFFRLFTLLESACHELDVRGLIQGGGSAYEDYVRSFRREVELTDKCNRVKAELSSLDQLVTIFTLTTSIAAIPSHVTQLGQLQSAVSDKKKELHDMETERQQLLSVLTKTFKKEEGPFVRALDKALQSFRVQRQAYYSGTFVGNHVHRSLKGHNIRTMCQSMVKLAQTNCPTLLNEATALFNKFEELFERFSKCHNIYDQNYVTDDQATELGDHITNFMSYYREQFPHASVLPKMHMLEEHVLPWLRKWGVGFGLLGEQGIESIHAHFNSLGRTYRSIPEEVARLRHLMTEHLLHIAPEHVAATPAIKRRKRRPTSRPED